LTDTKKISFQENRFVLTISALFVFDLLLVLILTKSDFNQKFFGADGRSTGFVAYFSLVCLFVIGVLNANRVVLGKFCKYLIGSGVLSVIYGLAQALGKDPIKWDNGYSPVIGFLGNPDFQSSFVGFSAILVFSLMLRRKLEAKYRATGAIFLLLAIFVIKQTYAQQGFFVLVGGAFIVGVTFLHHSDLRKVTFLSLICGGAGGLLAIFGSLNFGPLANLLHKESVIYRGDYWRAGWSMTIENPLFGVGLDSYGDWYRRSRTVEATLRRGPDIVSNSAHNVLLDFSSNGGFPLLALYLLLMILVARSVWRVYHRNKEFDPIFTGLFAVWAAYQAQSLISLNQLGLAIWGWVISGLIIGWDFRQHKDLFGRIPMNNSSKIAPVRQSTTKMSPRKLWAISMGFLSGLLFGLPPFVASISYLSAIQSGEARQVLGAAYISPIDSVRMAQIGATLRDNNLESEALKVLTDGVRRFPDSFDLWKLLLSLENTPTNLRREARAELERIDPYNSDF
jgi:O-antigen ligase